MKKEKSLFVCLLLAVGFFLSGCGPKTTVILLPEDDGNVGHVIVESKGGTVDIKEERGSTTVSGSFSAPGKSVVVSQEVIEKKYAVTLANLPEQPRHFILYFKSESVQLTHKSSKLLLEIVQQIKDISSPDVGVIAHTDTAGDAGYNMRLSKRRAITVKHLLIKKGISQGIINTMYHGEHNPLVKTPDNTHERKNRRVEVIVR